MYAPSTPKKQARLYESTQQATPPPTLPPKETTNHQDHILDLPIRPLTYDTSAEKTKSEYNSDEDVVKQTQSSPSPSYAWSDQAVVKEEPQDQQERVHETKQLGNEVKYWISSATTDKQVRERFNNVLHSFWPSNDEFNAARHPFYDPEEDGPYDEFIKYEMWDGTCPYDDDDYDPFTDPTRSTEVWQPQIGDEGIENKRDLSMVLLARQQHNARAERFNEYRKEVIQDQLRAGVEYADINLVEAMLAAPPSAAAQLPSSGMRPTKAKKDRGRPLGCKNSKNKKKNKKHWANKRKRTSSAKKDSTYKDTGGSEDSEQPTRKKGKKTKAAAAAAIVEDPGDVPWKAQTRGAARRARHAGGMDGSYESRGEDATETDAEMD
ncbi:hypothetical protein SAMD00023353_0802840 [Rosellinia necatrix]|uniref:Uncharacterized protein n=1 Tax=Rosellinia necatrix TaxID=77044 RepID=A0A1W2TBD3_ROSNE|nr:hypothetical protein SAMD00023353_0802840 [Rosellinia necatrix]